MLWTDIDFGEKRIRVIPDKRATKRVRPPLDEPIHPQLLIWLRLWQTETESQTRLPYIFPTLSQKNIKGRSGLSNTFTRLIDSAGIENFAVRERVEGSDRSRAVNAFSFHSLRSTFNTLLEAANVSAEVRMKLSDHTSREVNQLYTKPEWERLSAEIAKLPSV
jgi:integrase